MEPFNQAAPKAGRSLQLVSFVVLLPPDFVKTNSSILYLTMANFKQKNNSIIVVIDQLKT